MTKNQQAELEALTKAMMEWLDKNTNPHTTLIITPADAELTEGVWCNRNRNLRDSREGQTNENETTDTKTPKASD